MDKQSKLIFERYTRRTILEQTPVNSIAPVNVGVTKKPGTTIAPTLSTPGIKTTEFSNWSEVPGKVATDVKQVGYNTALEVGKFFAENPLGIAINTIDTFGVTSLAQIPYLINAFNKDKNVLNALILGLGIISVVPKAGTLPELPKNLINLRNWLPLSSAIKKYPDALTGAVETLRNTFGDTNKLRQIEQIIPKPYIPAFREAVSIIQAQLSKEELQKVLFTNPKTIQQGLEHAATSSQYGLKTLGVPQGAIKGVKAFGEKFKKIEPVVNSLSSLNNIVKELNNMSVNLVESLKNHANYIKSSFSELIQNLDKLPIGRGEQLASIKIVKNELIFTMEALSQLLTNIDTIDLPTLTNLLKRCEQAFQRKGLIDDLSNLIKAIDTGSVGMIDEAVNTAFVTLSKKINLDIEALSELTGGIIKLGYVDLKDLSKLDGLKAFEVDPGLAEKGIKKGAEIAKAGASKGGIAIWRNKWSRKLLLVTIIYLIYRIYDAVKNQYSEIEDFFRQLTGTQRDWGQ